MNRNFLLYIALAVLAIAAAIILAVVLPEGSLDRNLETEIQSSTGKVEIPLSIEREALPAFDVVRVNPKGDAVIAGRATAGAKVTVLDGGIEIGSVIADSRGEWVLLPSKPLASGNRTLTLIETRQDGVVIESNKEVIISIPEYLENNNDQGLVVLSPRDSKEPSRVLQAPSSNLEEIPQDLKNSNAEVGIESIDYDDAGEMIIAGRGKPGSALNIYVNDKYLGTVRIDESGLWELRPGKKIMPGKHTFRVDRVNEFGDVLGRIETPLTRMRLEEVVLGSASVVVQPGNSLWRIARRAYGGGINYTIIYEANRDLIRDPNLIYPGQIFSMPELN